MRVARLVLLFLVLLGAAACGSEEDEGGDGGAVQTVEVSETEFRLEPATFTLDEPGTYTFRAVNDGSVDHALEVEGGGVEEETDTIAPGESGELTVELGAGTYELYCPIGNHREQGMEGSVEVGGGAGGGGATTGETDGETDDDSDGGGSGYGS